MKIFYANIAIVLLFLSTNSLAAEEYAKVTFYNNSNKLLKCSLKKNGEYLPFIRLHPETSKHFDYFKLASQVRCSTEVNKAKRSSTMLTYFSVETAGVYEILQGNVPCKTCSKKYRLATIVTFPDGEPHYTKFK